MESAANTPRRIMSTLVVVAVAALGAVGGVAVAGTLQSSQAATVSQSAPPNVEEMNNVSALTKFDVNENGQTIGEYGVGLRSDPTANPDLVLAEGENGVVGYVYTTEVFGEPAADPKEASNVPPLTETIVFLYESDGKTVIGSYVANRGYPLDREGNPTVRE